MTSTTTKGDSTMEQTVQKPVFTKMADLTKDQVKAGQKNGEFYLIPATFRRSFAKKTSQEQTSIRLNVINPQMTQLVLKDGNDYLTPAVFHRILTEVGLPYKDEKGNDKNEWKRDVLCRFVKGSYTNRDDEYLSVEVIFKQGLYLVHFFTYDETQLINTLSAKGLFKFNFIDRPDKIEHKESSERFDF